MGIISYFATTPSPQVLSSTHFKEALLFITPQNYIKTPILGAARGLWLESSGQAKAAFPRSQE